MAAGPYATQTHVNNLWGESLTVTSVRPNSSNVAAAVTGARYLRGARERRASYGNYTAADEVFTIATDAVAFTPKPRDTVTRGSDVLTVLSVDGSPWLKFWILTCVNLVLAADLRSTGTLSRPNFVQDDAGRRALGTYTAVATDVPCRVQPADSAAVDALDRRVIVGHYQAILGTAVSARAQDRFVSGGVTYTVTGYRDPERIDDLMTLELELVP